MSNSNQALILAQKAIKLVNNISTQNYDVPQILESKDNVAAAIYIHADGGTAETIKIHSDQGNTTTSINLVSDNGGITLNASKTTISGVSLLTNGARIRSSLTFPSNVISYNANGALIATDLINGIITLNYIDTYILPTAASLVAALPSCAIGDTIQTVFLVPNSGFERIILDGTNYTVSFCSGKTGAYNILYSSFSAIMLSVITNITSGTEAVNAYIISTN